MAKQSIPKMSDKGEPSEAPSAVPAQSQGPPPEPDVADETGAGPAPFGEFFSLSSSQATDDAIKDIINRQVQWIADRHPVTKTHTVVYLYQSSSLSRSDANRIYRALADAENAKPLLLILSSTGGEVPPAYFISKLCRQSTRDQVKIAVARQAKSAATLICCGADEIHMGGLSELGPIDPQFGLVPALALKYSIEHLAQLACQYPGAREMFSD